MNNPISDLLEAVDALTKPIADPVWQDELDARGRAKGRRLAMVNRAPRLVQLRQAIASSTGQTHAGHSDAAARAGGLNLAAFTLYEDIDGRIRAAWAEVGDRSKDDPEILLRRWFVHTKNLHVSGQLSDSAVMSWRAAINGWVRNIDSMFNPEVVKELKGPCPNCEAERFKDRDGVEKSALYLHYSEANEPEAVCRTCGWAETGPRRLLELGYHLGAVVDEDTLREMGVIA